MFYIEFICYLLVLYALAQVPLPMNLVDTVLLQGSVVNCLTYQANKEKPSCTDAPFAGGQKFCKGANAQ